MLEETVITDDGQLDRSASLRALIGDHRDFLLIAGLGSAQEVSALTDQGAHAFVLGGAMGAACMMGLGLALAQPARQVLVVTGDGDLLMNLGSLATIATVNPPNLAIVCVDNGHYGETGYQQSHTSLGVDLKVIARGCGFKRVKKIETEADIPEGSRLIREQGHPGFIHIRVKAVDGDRFPVDLNGPPARHRFKAALGV